MAVANQNRTHKNDQTPIRRYGKIVASQMYTAYMCAYFNRYYGCGVIAPDDLEGLCVLDLGCGAGMDCFVLSRVVGQAGFVTGIDVTDEQVSDIFM